MRVKDIAHAVRSALVRGIPLFNGCAACPDAVAWRKRRARFPEPDFPVDFVFTWVDGSDPAHADKYDRLRENLAPGAALEESRHRDNGELRYALRSLELYAPWARRIFLVTDNQVPAWLDAGHPKIRVVDHTEIIPAEYLPTFSSRVIEAHLHLIPGLAEHYVYCNDDFFLLSPCEPRDFFSASGLPWIFTDWRKCRRRSYTRATTPHASSYALTRRWLKARGICPPPDLIAAHVPYPQTRRNSADAYAFYEDFIRKFAPRKFRDHSGMVLTCHGAPLWAYAERRAAPMDMPYIYLNSRRYDHQVYYAAMLREKDGESLPPFLCINDAGISDAARWLEHMLDFLEKYYPQTSGFEKAGNKGTRLCCF
jgi:hypothetical protein